MHVRCTHLGLLFLVLLGLLGTTVSTRGACGFLTTSSLGDALFTLTLNEKSQVHILEALRFVRNAIDTKETMTPPSLREHQRNPFCC
jgi:hypothetical protein